MRSVRGQPNIQLLPFWPVGTNPANVMANGRFNLMPLDSLGAPASPTSVLCNFNVCELDFGAGFDPAKEYLLVIEFGGKRYWGQVKVFGKAAVVSSKDVTEKRREVRVTTKVPLNRNALTGATLVRSEYEIDPNLFIVKEKTTPIGATITGTNDVTGNNITEVIYRLDKKLNEGMVTTLSVPNMQVNLVNPATNSNYLLTPTGPIEIAGLASPPEAPKTVISFAHIAANRQKPVFELSGTTAFRRVKFATLIGRYSPCSTGVRNQNETYDASSEECRGGSAIRSLFFGQSPAVTAPGATPPNFFAGFDPMVSFDIGFNSTKSKNSIIVNLPFVYYLNYSNRNNVTAQADAAVAAEKAAGRDAIPLYVYGGWLDTPNDRLADVKFSFGPKIEFYRKYRPRNLLGSLRGDFEFHKWLGTISARRKLISADLNLSASKDEDKKIFGRLPQINFGWKLVPYAAFDGGAHVTSETVSKKFGSMTQSVVVPHYNIARISGGATGLVEWVVARKYVGFSFDYAMVFIGSPETNSVATSTRLELRRIRGFQPFFKTTLEFALDPAKRYAFKAVYENGRALPSLEYLNKVTTGISITY